MKKETFCWDEFLVRFLLDHEEFAFSYHDKMLYISYVSDNSTALAYGDKTFGYIRKNYNSPLEFLEDPIFDGKRLNEIWEEIWP